MQAGPRSFHWIIAAAVLFLLEMLRSFGLAFLSSSCWFFPFRHFLLPLGHWALVREFTNLAHNIWILLMRDIKVPIYLRHLSIRVPSVYEGSVVHPCITSFALGPLRPPLKCHVFYPTFCRLHVRVVTSHLPSSAFGRHCCELWFAKHSWTYWDHVPRLLLRVLALLRWWHERCNTQHLSNHLLGLQKCLELKSFLNNINCFEFLGSKLWMLTRNLTQFWSPTLLLVFNPM